MSTEFLPAVSGQSLAKSYFQRTIANGRLSHSYLFWGDRGSQKHLFAHELAKAIHCDVARPCGNCVSCRSIDHANHPAVHVFGPAEGKSIIDIDTVRELCERVQYKTDRTNVVILKNADLLREAAANALLKTLEEPPAGAVLILVARSTGSLLPTIVSRCHRIPFRHDTPATQLDDDDNFLRAVSERSFFADHDVREWLDNIFPEAESQREAVKQVLERLLPAARRRVHVSVDKESDAELQQAELCLELLGALEGNVHADLVLERLFAHLRSQS